MPPAPLEALPLQKVWPPAGWHNGFVDGKLCRKGFNPFTPPRQNCQPADARVWVDRMLQYCRRNLEEYGRHSAWDGEEGVQNAHLLVEHVRRTFRGTLAKLRVPVFEWRTPPLEAHIICLEVILKWFDDVLPHIKQEKAKLPIEVDREAKQIILYGTRPYSSPNDLANIFVEELVRAHPRRRSVPDMIREGLLKPGTRLRDLKRALPKPVVDLIDSEPGQGSCLALGGAES
jgi:hypothetical protein